MLWWAAGALVAFVVLVVVTWGALSGWTFASIS